MSRPTNIEETAEAIRMAERILPVGAGTKVPLAIASEEAEHLDMRGLAGIVEYDPGEYTISAWAGTRLGEVMALLRENGQYLPFDPPFAEAGSTLGGMVAAGINGPGRLRFGGIRDFLIGVTFVTGEGRLVRGGGKVVKNAAGFDFPKFLAGSLGRFGVLGQLTFKVFPLPEAFLTIRFNPLDLADALDLMSRLAGSSWEPDALEMVPDDGLYLRLGGMEGALRKRAERILRETDRRGEVLEPPIAETFWREANAFSWVLEKSILAKVPLTAERILKLDSLLVSAGAVRRYGMAGGVAWVAWPAGQPSHTLDVGLREQGLAGLVFRGKADAFRLGSWPEQEIFHKVKHAFDSVNRFPSMP